ncbi:hypothetical protein HYW76_03210 [Candidatus Pacearchaeota archaeon]|nr:hypothetical protein [Candidatus Pacearchaeota archaeon]
MKQQIKAAMILEILGKPADYVKTALGEIVEKMGKEERVNILSKTIAEPKPIEGHEGVFTTFADIELETDIEKLMILIFEYMPSHLEIVYPEKIEMTNADSNSFFNELARRLHQYDELTKTLLMEKQILMNYSNKEPVEAVKNALEGNKDIKEKKKKKR